MKERAAVDEESEGEKGRGGGNGKEHEEERSLGAVLDDVNLLHLM